MKRFFQLLMLCGVLAPMLWASDNSPTDPKEKARYSTLGSKIMCTCGCSQMLLKCNHVGCPSSNGMERELATLVSDRPLNASGGASVQGPRTDEDVLNWFRKTRGVTAVVEPSSHGFELIAWIMPFAALILGFALVVVVILVWRVRRPPVAPADLDLDPALEAFRARAHRETEV